MLSITSHSGTMTVALPSARPSHRRGTAACRSLAGPEADILLTYTYCSGTCCCHDVLLPAISAAWCSGNMVHAVCVCVHLSCKSACEHASLGDLRSDNMCCTPDVLMLFASANDIQIWCHVAVSVCHAAVPRTYMGLSDDVLVLTALGGRSDWRTHANVDDRATPATAALQHCLHESDAVVRKLEVWIQVLGSSTPRDTERRTPCMRNAWMQPLRSDTPHLLNTDRCACVTWYVRCPALLCMASAVAPMPMLPVPSFPLPIPSCGMICPWPCTAVNGFCCCTVPMLPVPSSPLPMPSWGVPSSVGM